MTTPQQPPPARYPVTATACLSTALTPSQLAVWLQSLVQRIPAQLPAPETNQPRRHLTLTLTAHYQCRRDNSPAPDPEACRLPRNSAPALKVMLQALTSTQPSRHCPSAVSAQDALEEQGYTVSSRAWPALAAWHHGNREHNSRPSLCIVLPARHYAAGLRKHQSALLALLATFGVPCYRYDQATGFTRISAPTPNPKSPQK